MWRVFLGSLVTQGDWPRALPPGQLVQCLHHSPGHVLLHPSPLVDVLVLCLLPHHAHLLPSLLVHGKVSLVLLGSLVTQGDWLCALLPGQLIQGPGQCLIHVLLHPVLHDPDHVDVLDDLLDVGDWPRALQHGLLYHVTLVRST